MYIYSPSKLAPCSCCSTSHSVSIYSIPQPSLLKKEHEVAPSKSCAVVCCKGKLNASVSCFSVVAQQSCSDSARCLSPFSLSPSCFPTAAASVGESASRTTSCSLGSNTSVEDDRPQQCRKLRTSMTCRKDHFAGSLCRVVWRFDNKLYRISILLMYIGLSGLGFLF